MGLKEGSLRSLFESRSDNDLAKTAFHQMLQALDFLATYGLIHRHVKPDNILYETGPDNQYQFQLGDFGLCTRTVSATTTVGTPYYMAPEMLQNGKQTDKVDVWSLFVTMVWTLDVGGFRQTLTQLTSIDAVYGAVLHAAKNQHILSIREMAEIIPECRASAAQMLVKCFNGEGLSTPRHRVPALG